VPLKALSSLEGAIGATVGEGLSRLSHKIERMQTYDGSAVAICAIEVNPNQNSLSAAAGHRRESYAIAR
jgi:hypothetical protein